jgi:hypothetical protein
VWRDIWIFLCVRLYLDLRLYPRVQHSMFVYTHHCFLLCVLWRLIMYQICIWLFSCGLGCVNTALRSQTKANTPERENLRISLIVYPSHRIAVMAAFPRATCFFFSLYTPQPNPRQQRTLRDLSRQPSDTSKCYCGGYGRDQPYSNSQSRRPPWMRQLTGLRLCR